MPRRLSPGQTLVEMLIVLFIISVGLYGAVTLIFANVGLQQQDADQTAAMNLAREALEMVQNQRDSNWLAGDRPFDYGMLTTGPLNSPVPVANCTAVPQWEGISVPSPFFLLNPPDNKLYRSTQTASRDLFINVTTVTTTDFGRSLLFMPLCQDPSNSTNRASADGLCACPPAAHPTWTTKVGMRARVDVPWTRNGRSRQLTLYADYYDWR